MLQTTIIICKYRFYVHLLNMTSNFHTIGMFVGMFISVISVKMKDKHFHTDMMFYILQNTTLTKVVYFWKTYYHVTFQDPIF